VTARSDRLCSVPGCGLKHQARGYCPKHYAALWYRKFGDKRDVAHGAPKRRPERWTYNRARSRALTLLAMNHQAEFKRLFAIQLAQAKAEADAIAMTTGEKHTKLRPGPWGATEDATDRIKEEPDER
jgi:hypothetical protein